MQDRLKSVATMEKPKFKTVQEVVAAGERLSERYLLAPTDEPLNCPLPEMDIPAIDLSLLFSSCEDGREELSRLHSALSTWGVVQVMNHGITEAFLDKIYNLTKQFFALPAEEKHKYAREAGNIQGYGNDVIPCNDQVLDWLDRLVLTTYPEDKRQLKFWPQVPTGFSETLHEYTMKQRVLIEKLFKAMARSLELEENCFLKMYGENAIMNARFNFFPPCPRPDKVIGIKAHGDGSAITLLLPDRDVEGLQFFKDGKWYKAPMVPPNSILINLGDQMEIMSNGIFKSPFHRVVTNGGKERISVVTFCVPDLGSEIQPADGLVTEERPRLYKTVTNFGELYHKYYHQGRRTIEAALI